MYFTRYGDGEFMSMMGHNHRNYNFSYNLQKELIECFKIDHPQFLIASVINIQKEKGMSKGLFAPYGTNDLMEEFVIKNKLYNQSGIYENHIMFHYLTVFKPKLIYDFFEEFIRYRNKMFVGCTNKSIAEKFYGNIDYYVNVPSKHAYCTIDKWWPEIERNSNKVELIIPSAGAASNVISKRLWNLEKDIHLLDIGSLIDAFESKISRTWIRLQGHKVNKILPEKYREKRLLKRIIFLFKNIKCYIRSYIKN